MNIVFQAYGATYIINQTLFAIASICEMASSEELGKLQIFIYTDNEAYLKDYVGKLPFVKIVAVTKEQIKKWRGDIDFVHRVKLEIIKHCVDRFGMVGVPVGATNATTAATTATTESAEAISSSSIPNAAPSPAAPSAQKFLYLDGDVIFKVGPKELFDKVSDKQSVMHECEYQLSTPKGILGKKMSKFVLANQNNYKIPLQTYMWNAGVIGFSIANSDFLQKAIERTDQMYRSYQKHVIEQLAVSWTLSEKTQIYPAIKEIWHYWDSKEVLQKHADSALTKFGENLFFSKSVQNLLRPQDGSPKEVEEDLTHFWSQFHRQVPREIEVAKFKKSFRGKIYTFLGISCEK